MRALTDSEVHAQMVDSLGLDSSAVDLSAPESIAAGLRRAGGFLCPCSQQTLVRSVLHALEGLVGEESLVDTVNNILESMVAYGDFLEQQEVTGDNEKKGTTLLYAAPPAFVVRDSGMVFLLGIAPEQLSPLSEDLASRIDYVSHVRRLHSEVSDLRASLLEFGLIELSSENWIKAPTHELAAEHVARLDRLLNGAPQSLDIPGLTLMDPAKPVRYYRGRWVPQFAHSGRLVGRRPQAYGAHIWCYVELGVGGQPRKLLDLPLSKSPYRGCDEAWRLQAAIDSLRGQPQQYRLRPGPNESVLLDLFSPVPKWAQRRWDSVGQPVQCTGCLFSYRFPKSEIQEEVTFAREHLWLVETT